MKNTQAAAKQYGVLPKLKLGNQLPGGGVKPTGPHHVKFVEDDSIVPGRDDKGVPRKEFRYVVEENGVRYHWNVAILNKDGQPNYLIERLMDVNVGDERILEMLQKRGRNYIDVRKVDEAPSDEVPDELGEMEASLRA